VVQSIDWDYVTLDTHPTTSVPYLREASRNFWAGIYTSWHASTVQLKDMNFDVRETTNVPEISAASEGGFVTRDNVSLVIFNGEMCIAKVDKWKTRLYDTETKIYSHLRGKDIAPEFIGHIAEGPVWSAFCFVLSMGGNPESTICPLAKKC
jgi:hypothetical protein